MHPAPTYFAQFSLIPLNQPFGGGRLSLHQKQRRTYRPPRKFNATQAEALRRRYKQYGLGFREISKMSGCSLRTANQVFLQVGAYKNDVDQVAA